MTSSPRPSATALRVALTVLLAAALACAACSRRNDRGPDEASAATPDGGAAAGIHPSEDAVSKLNVGVRLLEQLLPADAAPRFEAALALQPGWLPALVDLAIARMNILDPAMDEAAAQAAQEALRVAPNDARAKYVLAYARAERQRRFGDALVLLRDVVKAESADAAAWYQLGRAAQELADDPQAAEAVHAGTPDALRAEAEAGYRKALEIDHGMAEANYKLGRLLLDSSDPAKQAEGEAVLARHEEILKGRPAVQQNYYRRGALALAYPFTLERPSKPMPTRVVFHAKEPLPTPTFPDSPDAPGLSPMRYRDGITLADLDGDGRLDVLAPNRLVSQPSVLVWYQLATGAFEAPRAFGMQGRASSSAPVGDFDGDGDLDILVTTSAGNLLLRNAGDRTFALAPQFEMNWPSVAGLASTVLDVDHDGDLDIHVVEPLAQRAPDGGGPETWRAVQWIWRNDGLGVFGSASGSLGLNVELDSHEMVWADFDGDNAIDLVTSVAGQGLSVARNDRSEHFTVTAIGAPMPKPSVGPPAFRIVAFDADDDMDLDLVMASAGTLTLLLNESKPGGIKFTASDAVPLPGREGPGAMLVGDMDLDGNRELVLFGIGAVRADDSGGDPSLLTFTVAGRAIVVPMRPVSSDGLDPQVALCADIDGDGDVDILARKSGGAPVVLRNEMPAGPAWISVLPVGRTGRSNAAGVGAKITLDAGTLRAHVEHRSLGAPLCHSLAPETFGLGGRAALDGIGVLWPSGIQQAELDVTLRTMRKVEELDRQPSSCPMLYGWNGSAFGFLTDCFDTAPAGLWVAPGTHVAGDPEEVLRLRPGSVQPIDGVLNLSVAEFLNESLLADRIGMLAIDDAAGRSIVVDEGVRLAAPPPPFAAWSLGAPMAVPAKLDGRDVSAALAATDRVVAGWSRALQWTGLAQPQVLSLDVPAGARVLVLTGSLNFPNSSGLFGAAQAGISPQPARLEIVEARGARELLADCGVPAGFHKDVVIDLAPLKGRAARLRLTTNLQVSWDCAIAHADAHLVPAEAIREVPLLRAEKMKMGIPWEVQGPENRWREFPRDRIDPRPRWKPQSGSVTPDGDVRDLLRAVDGRVAIVRPGEEVLVAFDDAAVSLAPGLVRTHVLATHGWVKDRDPHTALSESVDPLPRPGAATYP